MSYCSVKPSLALFPSFGDRKFSHAELGQGQEYPYHVITNRDVYTQADVDCLVKQDIGEEVNRQKLLNCAGPHRWFSGHKVIEGLLTLFPVLTTIRNYKFREYILGDFISGLSVACMHFPQGLAYGLLASLSPAQGLYASFFPVLFYVVFGTSPHMSIGTDAVMAIITAEAVESEVVVCFGANGNNTDTTISEEDMLAFKASIASGCTLIAGSILSMMGILRLGFLTSYQSTSFIGGFTTAASFHIFTSQIPQALGMSVPLIKGPGKLVFLYQAVIENIYKTNWISLVLVIISVAFLLVLKDFINVRYRHQLKMPVPADLLLIIIATAASAIYRQGIEDFPIEVVGQFSKGLPYPAIPRIDSLERIFVPSLQMAMISFFLTIAMAKLCAEKHEYEINDNQELMAYGLLNISSSFFSCFPACTSPPRSMLLSAMGARTTLNGIFTSCVLLLVLLILGQLFTSLPVPVLAAMILVSVKPLLLQVRVLPKLFRINRYDVVIWVVTCMSGILIDLPYGLVVGIVTSFIVFMVQSQLTSVTSMYWDNKHRLFLDKYDTAITSSQNIYKEGIRICRINSPIYFATTETLRKSIYNMTVNPMKNPQRERAPSDPLVVFHSQSSMQITKTPSSLSDISRQRRHSNEGNDIDSCAVNLEENEAHIKVIILVCSSVSYIDIQGINALSVMFEEYRRIGISVFLAGCTPIMVERLRKSDFYDNVSADRVFYQVEDAYQAAIKLLN